jgi:hypothetical protein
LKRTIHLCTQQGHFTDVNMLMENGWELDPAFGKPIALENGVVYHLVRYEAGEEPKPEAKPGEFDDVVETREMPHGPVPDGFTVQAIYAKAMIVIRRRPKEAEEVA